MKNPVEIILCEDCHKPPELCICAELPKLEPKIRVLILQHPQEPDKELGTARILNLALKNSILRVGLSWANLTRAIAEPSMPAPNPKEWVVLHLGSGIKAPPHGGGHRPPPGSITFLSKKGQALPEGDAIAKTIKGIVILDGTWSQAKALWWRNAWLLKLQRAVLTPPKKSLYGKLRREPRPECISTLETAAYTLSALGEDTSIETGLLDSFKKLLNRFEERKRN